MIRRIEVLAPIRWTRLRRNEVGSVITGPDYRNLRKGKGRRYDGEEDRDQRSAMCLRDVRYRIHAQIVVAAHARKGSPAHPPDSEEKYREQLRRRLERGACFSQPFFGCREFTASLASRANPAPERAPRADPEVAFAEHPQLGIIAATSDHSSALGGPLILEENGWRLDPDLDIYTLLVTADRTESVQKVPSATVAMQRSGLQVAVHPRLAGDAALRRAPAPTSAERLLPGQGVTPSKCRNAAALAASPARSGLRDKAPIPAPAASAASGRPADPRIAFSRNR